MKTLLIDNYDSFTYNLFQLLAEVNEEEPIVVRHDQASWSELEGLTFQNIVISPGPGRPERARDFGVSTEAIRNARVPLLGVCLGHQGLGWVHGAKVIQAPEAVHGRASAILHRNSPLLAGIPREFQAVRYHSLCLERPLPPELEEIAWTSDGVLMALAHRSRPQWGVQFHPESICTEHGWRLLANFRGLTEAREGFGRGPQREHSPSRAPVRPRAQPARGSAAGSRLTVQVRRLEQLYDSELAFLNLYGDSQWAFWLDSSRLDGRARFSFMGAAGGPLGARITYGVESGELRVARASGTEVLRESIFEYLSAEMGRLRCEADDLPFDFNCGFVGYFGYELKGDCGAGGAGAVRRSALPDAAFLLADRLVVFDHLEECTYILCLSEAGEAERGNPWISETVLALESLSHMEPPDAVGAQGGEFRLSRSHERYIEDVAACKERLGEGESYEICLTNQIHARVKEEPLVLYRRLRRVNPAPFSAYLRFGRRAILSSSPERFLQIGRDRWVQAQPIKGTSPRGETPTEDVRLARALRSDEKNRAENLMITDLLRNDLGMVCEIGTVHVPSLMQVESYETVHQLVSTVRGRLRQELAPPDCIRACFPGGSMTGAPKKRTLEIIDQLEREARGVYSGAIGYLGLSGGCDLSVVIRTIVIDGARATLGVGGAIVMQSEAEDEYQEMLLKARAPMAAIDPTVDPQAAFPCS